MTPAPSFPSVPALATTPALAGIKQSAAEVSSKTTTAASSDNESPPRDFNAVFSKCAPKVKPDKNTSTAKGDKTAGSENESSDSDSASSSFESPVTDAVASIASPLVPEPVVVSPMALWALRFQKQFGGKEPAVTAGSIDIAPDSSVKANVTTATLGCVTPPVFNPNPLSKFTKQPGSQIVDGAIDAATAASGFQPQVRPTPAQLIGENQPAPAPTTVSATALVNPPFLTTASAAVAPFMASAISSAAFTSREFAPVSGVADSVAIEADQSPISQSVQPQEKLAAANPTLSVVSAIGALETVSGEFLTVEKQQLAKPVNDVGTEVAKPPGKMASRFEKSAVETRTPEVAARVAHSADAVAPVGSAKRPTAASEDSGFTASPADGNSSAFASADTASANASVTTTSAPSDSFTSVAAAVTPSNTSISPPSSSPHAVSERLHEIVGRASDAAGAVREVVDMTHEFRARERSSVEVKFNFKDDTELSVRIAVKAGEVQTTFRTDSAELRSTLGREWQQQLVANASDAARTARLVDPVFTSNSSEQGSTSANGGDAQRQSFSQHEQSAANRGESFANSFNSTGSRGGSTTTARPAVSHRPETVRHLHVFA